MLGFKENVELSAEQMDLLQGIMQYCTTMCEIYKKQSNHEVNGMPVWKSFVYSQCLDFGLVGVGNKINRKRKTAKQCFANSQAELMDNPDKFTYVEGIAIQPSIGLPIHHGWLVDKEGKVLDLTWKEPESAIYLGVPFDYKFVLDNMIKSKSYSSLFIGNNFKPTILGKKPEEYIADEFLEQCFEKEKSASIKHQKPKI